MKRGGFLICGLCNLGSYVGRRLFEKGQKVIAIDIDKTALSVYKRI